MAQDVAEKIRAAAVAKGIDPDTALRIAGVESSYNPSAKNPRSSAQGLFQVVDDTWKRYGGKPGKQRDTDENIRVGMLILEDNTNKLSKILGRAPRPSELYTAHFFGTGTGAEVLRASPDTPINRIASKKVMTANPELKGLTVGQLMAKHEAKFARAPGTPAYVGKKGGERQDDTQQMMTDALSSGQTAQAPTVLDDPRIKALGTNYQMALAATALADKDDDKEDDGTTEAERFQGYMEERQAEAIRAQEPDPARKALASFDLSYKSPFVDDAPAGQAPIQMALGGMANAPPPTGIRQSERAAIESANAEWERYKASIDRYNADADSYNSMATKAKADADKWMEGYEKAGQPPQKEKENKLIKTTSGVFAEMAKNARQNKYATDNPYTAPDLTAPVQPNAPTVQPQELLALAQKKANNRNLAISAFFNPEQYNLSFSHGGAVHRAEGSPETGERLTPQQIEQTAQRQQDARDYRQMMMDAPTRGDTYSGFFKGVTQNLVPNIVGIPVDLTTMAMRPFGYKVEKPFLGSEYNKEKLTEFGMRPEPPAEGTNERNFYDVGNFASFFVNPASATRNAANTGGKLLQKGAQAVEKGRELKQTAEVGAKMAVEDVQKGAKKAKDMLNEMKKPKEVPQTVRSEPTMAPEVRTELEQLNQDRQYPRAPGQEPNPWMGVAPTVDEARANVAARQAEPLPAPPAEVAVPPALLETPPVAPPMQATTPDVIRPFVGRLDTFVDTIKNPVQLGQLKGQLKGKFRDYDLERVERAFAGMDDKTKLTPDQIKQALAGTHPPSKIISETLPPDSVKYHHGSDNVWGSPLGTTNLYLEQAPEVLEANTLLRKATQVFGPFMQKSTSSTPTLEGLTQARALLESPELAKVVDPELISNLSKSFDRVEKNVGLIKEYGDAILNIERGFEYPVLYKDATIAEARHLHQPFFKFSEEAMNAEKEALRQKFMAQGSDERNARLLTSREISANHDLYEEKVQRIASQKVQELAVAEAQKHGINIPDVSLVKWDELNNVTRPMQGNTAFKESVANALEPSRITVHEATKNIKTFMDPQIKKVGDILYQRGHLYEGKHPAVAGKPYPISFTRFSEHEATIPGMGTVQGRHFHELQSDLYNTMTKEGSVHGNRAKDQAEFAKLEAQRTKNQSDALDQKQALQVQNRENPMSTEDYVSRMKEIDKTLAEKNQGVEHRIGIVSRRSSKNAPYNIQEPFANYETSPDVRRQMLMKGAIHSAIKDGKAFATFPGAESAQPQLYVGKIYPNLKQVAKDLGGEKAGFDVRQIQLPPDKDGNPITAWGITWSPETAARIVEKGIPFAKGGMVERQSADTRRYL